MSATERDLSILEKIIKYCNEIIENNTEEAKLSLIIPTLERKQAAMEYRREWLDSVPDGNIHIDGSSSFNRYDNYEEWLDKIEKNKYSHTPDWVFATTYFAVYNNKIIGSVNIRHSLNEPLLIRGGHIGYGVRPSERRKGFAAKMLALALEECKKLGIKKVLVTCDKDNIGSARTIQKNGGILENEFTDDAGGIIQRYWIDIG